ncbi:MAG: cyclic lactone autoinducer peptide [bacterium]|nr:cyclic lactone autoinducer peptide [bacterium]
MKKILSLALAAIALIASTAASTGCTWFLFDEPTAPKDMN